MDMWQAYIGSVREHTEALIAFDKFHVAQHLGAAVDSGPPVGKPGAASTRGRPVGEDALPVADAPGEHDAAATSGVHAAAYELVAGGPCVGDQGIGDAVVELPVAGLGRADVETLGVRLFFVGGPEVQEGPLVSDPATRRPGDPAT